MIGFYDRQGKDITLEQWVDYLGDRNYKVVQQDVVGDVLVSTVWLGTDYGYGWTGKPLIFETMVFGSEYEAIGATYRHSTEEQALAEHDQILAAVKAGTWAK